jgi:hypothetical protein
MGRMMRLRRIAEGLKKSRIFCLMDWHAYIDESYDSNTFCVGGFMAPIDDWEKIELAWKQRLDYENRKSAEGGFPPISRYHATDCANLKNEFNKQNGWNIDRQIRLSKKLCGIIASNAPIGIVIGGTTEDFKRNFPAEEKDLKRVMYRFTFIMHLLVIADVMKQKFPDDRVTVYWDRSKEYGSIARAEFDGFVKNPEVKDLARFFVTGAPLAWEDCVALQPADLMAYEGFKRVSDVKSGKDLIRKSLEAMLGKKTPITVAAYTDEVLKKLTRLVVEEQERESALWHRAVCDD